MEREIETCPQCGYDSALYTWDDLVNTVGSFPLRWRWALEGIEPDVVRARPAPGVWSAFEYLAHTGEVVAAHGLLLHVILTKPGTDLGVPPEVVAPRLPDTPEIALSTLEENCRRLVRKAREIEPSARMNAAVLDGHSVTAWYALGHVVHDVHHHLVDVGRGLHSLGAGAAPETGEVSGLFASGGGVPKTPRTRAHAGAGGMDGDAQADRRNHGRPWQALCIWSDDVRAELQKEGHAVAPGEIGENVAVSGIGWDRIRPGVRLRIGPAGTGALVEVTAYATPCHKIAASFRDGDYSVVHPDRRPRRARVHTYVLSPGAFAVGDPVQVEPASTPRRREAERPTGMAG